MSAMAATPIIQERDPVDPIVGRFPLVKGDRTFHDVTEDICRPVEQPNKAWWIFFLISSAMLGIFGISVAYLFWEGVAYRIEERNEEGARVAHRRDRGAGLEATMPGKVIAVKASPGQAVKKGDEVVVVEAMKMENALRAPRDGTIKTVAVEVGDMVGPGSVLVELE